MTTLLNLYAQEVYIYVNICTLMLDSFKICLLIVLRNEFRVALHQQISYVYYYNNTYGIMLRVILSLLINISG